MIKLRRSFASSSIVLNARPRFTPTTQLREKLLEGDRITLARSITLVESEHPDDKVQSQELLCSILKSSSLSRSKSALSPSFRIGLSGPPGVGKSTFIESFGMNLVNQGHKVAVLAIDPSSSVTGGSILGDKTRMMELAKNDNAFVRPTPARGALGGVARNTTESIILCEAAGYDIILIETVGVGQSEIMVSDMVDMFAVLVPPSGGDELQGIKKGIVELADCIIINKADGDLAIPATMTQIEYTSALKLLKPRYLFWRPPVLKVSSVTQKGMNEAWLKMFEYYTIMNKNGELERKRTKQRRTWLWRMIVDNLLDKLKSDPNVKKMIDELEHQVVDGRLTPGKASDTILKMFLKI